MGSWQRRGLGTALLRELAQQAAEEGIRHFVAEILADNRPMLALSAGHSDHGPEGAEKRVFRPACLSIQRAPFSTVPGVIVPHPGTGQNPRWNRNGRLRGRQGTFRCSRDMILAWGIVSGCTTA